MARLFVVSSLLIALCAPAHAAGLTAADLRAMLQTQDAIAVVHTLNNGESGGADWIAVLDHIEAGEQDWLDLVPTLAPGTDAGTAEDMVITLSRALKSNARGVLQIMAGDLYSVDYICLSNEIESPVDEVVTFLDAAIPAVAAVLDPDLRQLRNDCLLQLGAERVSALVDPQ